MPVLFRCRLRRKIIREPHLIRLAQEILALSGDPKAELSLEIVGNTRIRRLNHQYRHQDRPTDVLAFPMREAAGPPTPLLGDVVISFPKAVEQASRHDHSIEEELVQLLIHGILHLKGFDHEKGRQAGTSHASKGKRDFKKTSTVSHVFE